MNMFSAGQKNRVDFFLSSSTYRGSNISASTLNATGVNTDPDCGPIADFYTDDQNTIICQATGTVTFKDYSYNGEILEREWIFEGGTPSISTFANPTVQYANSGLFTVTLIVKNNEGSDTLVRTQFISVLPAVAERKAPYGQDFEDVNATIGWELQNASPYGWMVDNSRGYLSSHSARAYITSNTDDGDKFSMIMPPVDVSVHGTPLNLTFKHAYSRRSTTLTEVMLIAISEDCGKTWTTVKGFTASNGLASITGANPGWFPTSASDWGYQVVNLDKYANSKNLMIRFDVISKSGNSVYIDDINLAQFGLSAESLSLANKVQLYPNPASDQITVELQFDGKATIYLRDLSGRVLKVEELNGSLNLINTGSLAAGMYIAEIRIGDYVWSQKLIIN
jgi:PKD repeat protein